MKKSVVAIVKSQHQADKLVDDLRAAGFTDSDISVLMRDSRTGGLRDTQTGSAFDEDEPPRGKQTNLGLEKGSKAGTGGATGAAAGGIIGGTIGLLAGLGTIAIPGLGALVAAGPILGALSGSAVGGSVGLITGSLVGLGVPEIEAKVFEGQLKEGGVLVAAHCANDQEIEQAKKICKANGVEKCCCTTETSASGSNRKNR